MNKISSLINKYDTAKTIKEKLRFLIEIARGLGLLIKQESKKNLGKYMWQEKNTKQYKQAPKRRLILTVILLVLERLQLDLARIFKFINSKS